MINGIQGNESGDLKGKRLIGTVIARNDPTGNFRIKVHIPKVFEGEAIDLPWVAPFWKRTMANAKDGAFGSFDLVPELNTDVTVEFQDGDPLNAVYSSLPVQSGEVPDIAMVNYGNRFGHVEKDGSYFFMDTTPGADPKMEYAASGLKISVGTNGNLTITTTGNVEVKANGSALVQSDSEVTVRAPSIYLTGN